MSRFLFSRFNRARTAWVTARRAASVVEALGQHKTINLPVTTPNSRLVFDQNDWLFAWLSGACLNLNQPLVSSFSSSGLIVLAIDKREIGDAAIQNPTKSSQKHYRDVTQYCALIGYNDPNEGNWRRSLYSAFPGNCSVSYLFWLCLGPAKPFTDFFL